MPEDNWWTEPLFTEITGQEGPVQPLERVERRVRYYLSNYVAEFSRHYFPANQSAECSGGHAGGGRGGRKQRAFHEDIDAKADLDRALKAHRLVEDSRGRKHCTCRRPGCPCWGQHLTERQARAIRLCLLGGYSEREAARAMGIARRVVRTHLARGVKQIAEILAGL